MNKSKTEKEEDYDSEEDEDYVPEEDKNNKTKGGSSGVKEESDDGELVGIAALKDKKRQR